MPSITVSNTSPSGSSFAPPKSGGEQLRVRFREDPTFEIDDIQMRELVRDLHRPNPAIFWSDLIATSVVGWGAFAATVSLRPLSWPMMAAGLVSAFALYRALCFLHEVSHQSQRSLPGFEAVWNALVGFPMLMPSFVYAGVHQSHHKLATYGTAQDPEYLPFAYNSRMTVVFAVEGFFIPAVLLARFLLLTPIGFVSRGFERWLVERLSSLTMNVQYRREATPELVQRVRRQSAIIFAAWMTVAGLAIVGVLPWRIFVIWFAATGLASFVNTLRTLGAHAYESEGEPLDRVGQLLDSIDTPGRAWTELWAPVGLRYHALHHYFPGIPYHNLAKAYGRIMRALDVGDQYGRMSSSSLQQSLVTLYKKGLRR